MNAKTRKLNYQFLLNFNIINESTTPPEVKIEYNSSLVGNTKLSLNFFFYTISPLNFGIKHLIKSCFLLYFLPNGGFN